MRWPGCSGTGSRWSWRCSPTAGTWRPTPSGHRRLLATWHTLAPLLRRFDPATTFPEVLNEPVFAGDPAAWAELQHEALTAIRSVLPANTIVLTGADWGSIAGLLSLAPEADPNVIYSIHLYEPAELTALGAYRPGLDAARDGTPALPGDRPDVLPGHICRHARCADRRPDALLLPPALGCPEGRRTDRRSRRLGPAPSGPCAGRGVRRLAAPECDRASRLAHRGAAGPASSRASAGRCGATTTRWDSPCTRPADLRGSDPDLLRALGLNR